MTTKDMVESIKHNMPEGLTQLEIARYIYIELGKQRRFDIKFYYGNSETRKKMRKLAMAARTNPRRYHNEKSIICISLSYLYKSILAEYGIDCSVEEVDNYNSGHLMPILTINDERRGRFRIVADLQRDLPWIQSGMMTENFGVEDPLVGNCTELYYEDLREIDRKIGYITDEYKDVDLYNLGQEIKGMDVHEALKVVLTDQRVSNGNNFQGHAELRQYYGSIMNLLLKRFNKRKAFLFTCHRDRATEENETTRSYTLCSFSYDGKECNPYLYSAREKRFIPVTIDKIIELEDDGLVIGSTEMADGTRLLKKILRNRRQELALQSESNGRE